MTNRATRVYGQTAGFLGRRGVLGQSLPFCLHCFAEKRVAAERGLRVSINLAALLS
jgi:hypothetical protein